MYQLRFIKEQDKTELINLYYLAKCALSGEPCSKYNRMIWASKWFAKEHSYVSSTGAYKDLEGMLFGN